MGSKIVQKQLRVGYAGMTHLGTNYAIASASKGFKTTGYDVDETIISELNNGTCKINEPNLHEGMIAHKELLTYTTSLQDLAHCDIVFVSLDVQTDAQGNSDLSQIEQLISSLLPTLKKDAALVILCQVPPSFTRQINWPNTQLFYQVETLVFGNALHRAQHPERLIIGCHSTEKGISPSYLSYLQSFECPILPMRYESAELAKIAINCCLVASISVTNSLSEICEKINADWSEIQPALKLDQRIGEHAYLKPGLGIAGGNLERDLATIVKLAKKYGTDSKVIESFQTNSNHRKQWVLKILHQQLASLLTPPKIAIWGLSYKENTHSIKNSPSVELVNHLRSFNIIAYDPVVKRILTPDIEYANSALDAAKDADILVVMTPWDEFKQISLKQVQEVMKGKIIIDPFMTFSNNLEMSSSHYFTLGKSSSC